LLQLFAYPLWGTLNDRIGVKRMLVLATIVATPGGILWMVVQPQWWWVAPFTVCVAAAGWSGVNLGASNLMLQMSQARGGRRLGTSYIAGSSIAMAIGGCLGGLTGGVIAESLQGWSGVWFGLPVTYHIVLFAISSGLRVVALAFLVKVTEPRPVIQQGAARVAVECLLAHLYSTVSLPYRVAVWLGRTPQILRPIARLGQRRDRKAA
jgi:MFS family permease